MMLYQEYAPHPALRPYLDCLWTSHMVPADGPCTHRVLPDNGLDILWQDGAERGFVAGMMSRAFDVTVLRPVRTVALRFKPGAAAHFFAVPLIDLSDGHAELPALWGQADSERLAEALWARPLEVRAQLDVLEGELLARLTARRAASDGRAAPAGALVRSAVSAIEASGGRLRIDALAQSLGISRQHLASQFRNRVGLSTKGFARVCRFRAASADIGGQDGAPIDWPRFALEHGYFDQSHLIHEFQAIAGTSPDAFAARRPL